MQPPRWSTRLRRSTMQGIPYKHGVPRDNTALRHLVEHSFCILYASTLGIHINQATTHKDIGLQISFNYSVVDKPPILKRRDISTCMEPHHKGYRTPAFFD